MTTFKPTVRFDDVTKSFGATTALRHLSAVADAGRVTGLVGPNGAGKTTAMRILLGLARPDTGQATIGGRPAADLAGRIGAVLESPLLPGLRGRTYLLAHAAALGIGPPGVAAAIAELQLDGAADRRIGSYSTGMRQRLALAGAFMGDPAVLVLDEPFNGLDPDGVRWLRDRIRAAAASGATVIVSSHLLAELETCVDDLLVLRTELVWAGTRDELTSTGRSFDDLYHSVVAMAEVAR